MKKILSILILLSVLVIMPAMALADEITGKETVPDLTQAELMQSIYRIGDWLFTGLLFAATILIIWAGFEYVTAGGDDTKITTARGKIKNALIGIVIAMVAKGLVSLVSGIVQ